MQDFRKVRVWRKAHALRIDIAPVARTVRRAGFPDLARQLDKSAGSICSNIVEGRARSGDREFARFLGYAIGSATELEGQVVEGRDLGAINGRIAEALIARAIEVRKMLIAFRRTLGG